MAATVKDPPEVSLRAVSLRRVTEDDLPTLEAWLRQPHVRRWWGEPAAEVAMIRGLMADPAATCLIARDDSSGGGPEDGGADFGYCQIYQVDAGDARTRAAWACLAPGAIGLDCFIGRPDRLGRGLGSAMVRAMLAWLRDRSGPGPAAYVFMAPDPANALAIRAYARAGLTPVGALTMPEGTIAMMVARLAAAA